MGFLKHTLYGASLVKTAATGLSKYFDMLARKGDVEKIYDTAYKLRGGNTSSAIFRPARSLLGTARNTRLGSTLTPEEIALLAKKSTREGAKVYEIDRPSVKGMVESGDLDWWKQRIRDQKALDAAPRKSYVENGQLPVKPDDLIEVTHGGGHQHIQDFLAGKTKGYPLEIEETGKQLGIQVTPQLNQYGANRAEHYARNAAFIHGDSPGILTARIKAKHLQKANNYYEAGLTPESVKHLQDVSVQKLPPGGDNYPVHLDGDVGYLPEALKGKLKTFFK